MNTNEVNRHRQFCQFRSEIRQSKKYMIVGIDVAKAKHHAFFGTANGKTLLKRLLFENDRQGFNKLIERAQQLQVQNKLPRVVFGMEPTGNYHKPLANWLLHNDHLLVLVSNKTIRDNRQSLDGRWDKNDTKDSANVTDLISQGKCQFFERPEPYLLELRGLLSLRKRLKKREHSLRMQIRNGLVTKYFPEFDRHWGSCLGENLAIVRWCLDPKKISSMHFRDFYLRVTQNDRGIRQRRRLQAIYDVAAKSVRCPMDSASRFEARILVEEIRNNRAQIDKTMRKIQTVCERIPAYEKLQTIPGFGPFISAQVLATIGDPLRFGNYKQVIRLAGLDLNAHRSGLKSLDAVPVISKRGNADLRYGLYQAALIATYHNDPIRELFSRYIEGRQKERGIRTKMRVKLAAKMLVIAWTLMKKKEPFDSSYLSSAQG